MYDLRGNNGPSTERPQISKRLRDEPEEQHHTAHWVAIAVLAAATGGVGWYAYPTWKQAPAMLAQFPAFEKSFAGMNSRLAEAEGQIKTWSSGQQLLHDQIAQMEKNMASRFHGVRKQMQDVSDKIYQRVHAEVAVQAEATQTELARLQSAGVADRASLEKLQTEVALLRSEDARQSEQLQNVKSAMEQSVADRDRQLVSLNDEVRRGSRDLDGLNQKLATKRVDFEVTRNHSQQLTEEISLGVTNTDVSHRRITGWMWVMPDRRTIWLRGQGAQEPVAFYGRDGKRRELVITNVAKSSVSGYLVLPVESSSTTTASLSKGD